MSFNEEAVKSASKISKLLLESCNAAPLDIFNPDETSLLTIMDAAKVIAVKQRNSFFLIKILRARSLAATLAFVCSKIQFCRICVSLNVFQRR